MHVAKTQKLKKIEFKSRCHTPLGFLFDFNCNLQYSSKIFLSTDYRIDCVLRAFLNCTYSVVLHACISHAEIWSSRRITGLLLRHGLNFTAAEVGRCCDVRMARANIFRTRVQKKQTQAGHTMHTMNGGDGRIS